jgi:hypothetical protein
VNKDDLPNVSFNGIPQDCLNGVRMEAQEKVVAAFPDARLLWNPKIDRYQVAIREDGSRSGWVDGQKLIGWLLIGRDFPPAVSGEEIVTELRRIHDFNTSQLAAMGYADPGEYVDAMWEKMVAEKQAAKDALADDIFNIGQRDVVRSIGGLTGEQSLGMNRLSDITAEREQDAASGRRHLRRGKVAAKRGLILNLNNLRT